MATGDLARSAFKALIIWVVIILFESINGAVREVLISPFTGMRSARVISFILALALISSIVYISVNWIGVDSYRELTFIGFSWAALTFIFEMVITLVIYDRPYERLAIDYDPRQGGLMLWGLAFLVAVPTIAFSLRRARAQA